MRIAPTPGAVEMDAPVNCDAFRSTQHRLSAGGTRPSTARPADKRRGAAAYRREGLAEAERRGLRDGRPGGVGPDGALVTENPGVAATFSHGHVSFSFSANNF